MTSASTAAKRMTMPEIKQRAKRMGIKPGKMKKGELIHTIQMAEGYTACYGRSNGECPRLECCWRSDCFKTRA